MPHVNHWDLIPTLWGLKPQNLMASQFWRLEVQGEGAKMTGGL